jgi:hypothetical protein
MPELWFVFSLVECTLLLSVWKRNLVSRNYVLWLGGGRREMYAGERNIIRHTVSQVNVVSVGENNR